MIYDILGWFGMILVLLAYFLLSTGKIKNGYLYQSLNLCAAIIMGIALYPKDAWFNFALEIIWGIIALLSIYQMIRKKK